MRHPVARDLAYHVIGLNTQCLWVTPTPIPGLHKLIMLGAAVSRAIAHVKQKNPVYRRKTVFVD